ncbi:hypothetical protein E2C01_096993 [Portunus trituberculatus]|uniref:Uncharacterized protein n=1 Tax=Portunus trituberculatus TaxID=210409 RepID=A0A5B7JZ96_PORTR|nr:hypothetical protein [Portunus trituberculatus]
MQISTLQPEPMSCGCAMPHVHVFRLMSSLSRSCFTTSPPKH